MVSLAKLPLDKRILDVPAAVFSAELLPFLNVSEIYSVSLLSRQIRNDMFDLRLLVANFSRRYSLYLSAFGIILGQQNISSTLRSLKYYARVFESF